MSLSEDTNEIKKEVKELSLAWELLDGCKKSNKRMFWIIIILIIAWLSTVGGFMYYITNYGYEESEEYSQEIEDIDTIEDSYIINGGDYNRES